MLNKLKAKAGSLESWIGLTGAAAIPIISRSDGVRFKAPRWLMTPQKAKLSAGVILVFTLPGALIPDQQRAAPKLTEAINRMMSLHDGDRGLLEVVACGKEAIGPPRFLLFKREPSGIYEPRRRVASALRSLQAYDVLREFLALRREISDPVERTGEDAVINAAARELMCRPLSPGASVVGRAPASMFCAGAFLQALSKAPELLRSLRRSPISSMLSPKTIAGRMPKPRCSGLAVSARPHWSNARPAIPAPASKARRAAASAEARLSCSWR
jgi:hypothetical protein